MAADENQTGRTPGAYRGLTFSIATLPDLLWSPLVAVVLIALSGCLGLLFGQPWLFASLGPSAYLIAHSPSESSAQPYNLVVGHVIGLFAGLLAVAIVGADPTLSVFVTHHLVNQHVVASALGLGFAILLELLVKASHPPAAATVLLMTLGGFPATLASVFNITAGVLIVAAVGEAFRRLRLRGR